MTQAIYIDSNERQYVVEAECGSNLMQAAVDNLVPGILGECGGDCACATCHVFVDPAWAERTGVPGEIEALLLEGLIETQATSRLCCQIVMSEKLDGIVLRVPGNQL